MYLHFCLLSVYLSVINLKNIFYNLNKAEIKYKY